MKTIIQVLVLLLPIISVIIAGIMAYYSKDGWGWFLLITVLTAHAIKHKKDDE